MVYKTCLSQFDSHMHEAQVRRGDLPGAYLHSTATTPFKTVCKQFINGSVPFGYSLNSGLDTGNDSWFSSGAWQVGTPVQKNACMYRCSVGGREQGTQRSELPLPVGSSSQRRKKKSHCACQKSENHQGPQYSSFRHSHSTCTHDHTVPRCAQQGGAGQLNPGADKALTQKVTTPSALNKLPTSGKREDT